MSWIRRITQMIGYWHYINLKVFAAKRSHNSPIPRLFINPTYLQVKCQFGK